MELFYITKFFLRTWIFFCCLFVRYFILCVVVSWVLQTSESVFSFSGVFYFTLLPHIWYKHHYNLLLSRFLWELAVVPWRLQGLPLWFEIQTVPSVCLYPIVFSKRYYSLDSILYVTFNCEALYITLAGFVIHSLKAPYVASRMSYLLANRSF